MIQKGRRSLGWKELGEGFGNEELVCSGCVGILRSPKAVEEVKVKGQKFCWALEALGALGDKTQLAHLKYYVTQIFSHSIDI